MGALSLTTQFTNFHYLSGIIQLLYIYVDTPQTAGQIFRQNFFLDRLALVGLRSGIGGWIPVVEPGWDPVRGPPWNPVLDLVEVLLKMHSPKLNLPQRRRIYTPYIIIYMPHLLIIYWCLWTVNVLYLALSLFTSVVDLHSLVIQLLQPLGWYRVLVAQTLSEMGPWYGIRKHLRRGIVAGPRQWNPVGTHGTDLRPTYGIPLYWLPFL